MTVINVEIVIILVIVIICFGDCHHLFSRDVCRFFCVWSHFLCLISFFSLCLVFFVGLLHVWILKSHLQSGFINMWVPASSMKSVSRIKMNSQWFSPTSLKQQHIESMCNLLKWYYVSFTLLVPQIVVICPMNLILSLPASLSIMVNK